MAGPPSPHAPKLSFVARHLDPASRLGEVLFGLIMVLTFTLAGGIVIQEGRDATKQMLVAVLGCNLAWGLIDAGMYLITALFERSRATRLLRQVREAREDDRALGLIGAELDPLLEAVTLPEARRDLYRHALGRMRTMEPEPTRLTRSDLYGAIASFWLVVASTIPAIAPFLVINDLHVALRVSNALLLLLLFAVGHKVGRATNVRPWVAGLGMLASGGLLVVVAIALGG
jgi:hypothetical protein